MSRYERIAQFEHVLNIRDARRARTRLITSLTMLSAVLAAAVLWL